MGVKLSLALTELGLIDGYEVRSATQASWPQADVVRGAIEACRFEGREPAGIRFGLVAMRYEPRR